MNNNDAKISKKQIPIILVSLPSLPMLSLIYGYHSNYVQNSKSNS